MARSYCRRPHAVGEIILVVFGKYSLSRAALLMKLHKVTVHKDRKCFDSELFSQLRIRVNIYLFIFNSVSGTGLKDLYKFTHLSLTTHWEIYYYPYFADEGTEMQRGSSLFRVTILNGKGRRLIQMATLELALFYLLFSDYLE